MNSSTTDRIERQIEIEATPAKVWEALTDYRQFGEWFGAELEKPFVPGQHSRGKITGCGHESMTIEFAVVSMEAERYFSYHWHPFAVDPKKDYSQEAPTLVEFRLEPTATGTLLVVIESGFDSVPAERRAEAFRMHAEGWTKQLVNIEGYVCHPG